MCKKLVLTNKLSLGAREIGWEAYSLPKGEVLEFTSKQLISIIKEGKDEVYGLQLSKDGNELEFDKAFFTTNLMNKVHINNLTPIAETECVANLFYIVIGTHTEKGNTVYEMISSRYERLNSVSEDRVKLMLEMGIITSGAKLENDKVVVASMTKEVPKKQVAEPKTTKEVPKKETK